MRRRSAVRDVPIDVQHAEPRYFGLGTPIFVLSARGPPARARDRPGSRPATLVVGVIAIVIAFCLLPAFLAGARRWPDTSIAQLGVSTADRVRDEAGFAVESVSAWSRAGRDVARLRKEQFTAPAASATRRSASSASRSTPTTAAPTS